MKLKSTIVVAAAAGAAGAALPPTTADAGPKQSVAAPIYTWTGFYVGGHAGYGSQTARTSGAYLDGATLRPFDHSGDPKGFLGGGQIGYNWQAGFLVFGAEADITGLSGNNVAVTNLPGPTTVTSVNSISWVGTVRGRLGVTVGERTMVYGTGGLAYGQVRNHSTENQDGVIFQWNADKLKTGYAAGGGIEHAVLHNMTVRLEGLYIDLGSTTMATPTSGTCDTACQPEHFTNKAKIVRGGINIKF